MLCQLFDGNAVLFVHLHALDKEKTDLDADGLWDWKFVAAVINLSNQIFHLIAVEGGHSNEHFVKHHT